MPSIAPVEMRRVLALAVLILVAVNLPYLLAYATPAPYVFGGILFNPIDGQSYFAKMREGWRGEWLFTLPYTARPGPGVFIFTYYLFLGHVARWSGASLDFVYHLARVAGGLALLLSAYHFIARFFESPRRRLAAWLCFALTSGLGWLYVVLRALSPRAALPEPLGGITADLWVAELIPFLSIFANSHFCFTAALMLWVFEWTLPGLAASPSLPTGRPPSSRPLIFTALAVTLIAQAQPLALITIGLVLGALTACAWHAISPLGRKRGKNEKEKEKAAEPPFGMHLFLPLLTVALSALPWLLYDYWIIAAHPILREWNAQNLTPSPPLWEALISGGLPLFLALPGLVAAARRRSPRDLILLAWFGLTSLSLYAPFSLQRRLSLGLWMPLTLLAGIGLGDVIPRGLAQRPFAIWPRLSARWRPFVVGLVAVGALTSNLLVWVSTLGGIQARAPEIFLTQDEAAAMGWLAGNAAPGALVLAGPATGLFLPARTDARVIYGHAFETVEAEAQKQAVEDFYAGRVAPESFLTAQAVDYIFYGPREAKLGSLPELKGWRVLFQQGEVVIYGR